MSLRNTADAYGAVTRSLHWLLAVLFLGLYASVYYRHLFTVRGEPGNATALLIHLSIGVSVLFLVALRVANRLTDNDPEHLPGKNWEIWAAKAGHIALYVTMIAMPVTGYLGTRSSGYLFGLVEFPNFPSTHLSTFLIEDLLKTDWETFENAVDSIHYAFGKFIFPTLLALHLSAAAYHHWIKKDGILNRIVGGRVDEERRETRSSHSS